MKKLIIPILIVAVVVVIYFLTANPLSPNGNLGGISEDVVELAGSRDGAATTPISYAWTTGINPISATKTTIVDLGTNVDTISINVLYKGASSTNYATRYYEFSNDKGCDTATTSASLSREPTQNRINWYDAAPLVTSDSTEVTGTGTTTFRDVAPATIKAGISDVIKDWNAQCLRFTISGASTTIYAELRAKKLE